MKNSIRNLNTQDLIVVAEKTGTIPLKCNVALARLVDYEWLKIANYKGVVLILFTSVHAARNRMIFNYS